MVGAEYDSAGSGGSGCGRESVGKEKREGRLRD